MTEIATFGVIMGFMVVLLVIHIGGKNRIFGMFLGLAFFMSGLLILTDGIEYKSGQFLDLNETAETLNVTHTYTNFKDTDPLQNNFFGVSGVLFGLIMVIMNFLNLIEVRRKQNS